MGAEFTGVCEYCGAVVVVISLLSALLQCPDIQ